MDYLQLFNNIINSIDVWDTNLLLKLNSFHNSFFDGFMWIATSILIWLPFYATVLYVIIKNKKQESLIIIIALALAIVLADQLSSSLIKPLVARLRPTHSSDLSMLIHIVNDYRGGIYGFVSSHAANSFAFAIFTSFLFRKYPYTVFIIFWAIIVSYSRIYLGVHFPLDIFFGSILGGLIGYGAFQLYVYLKKIMPQYVYKKHKTNSRHHSTFALNDISIVFLVFLLTLFFVILFAYNYQFFI